jgi:hypothetical protein
MRTAAAEPLNETGFILRKLLQQHSEGDCRTARTASPTMNQDWISAVPIARELKNLFQMRLRRVRKTSARPTYVVD